MRAKFTKENTIKVLDAYYKETEGADSKVDINTAIEYVGLYEDECAIVHIKLSHTINLVGEEIKVERELDKNEVFQVFNSILGNEGFEVNELQYDAGISSESYICDQGSSTPYFNGLIVKVTQKAIQKKIGGKQNEKS